MTNDPTLVRNQPSLTTSTGRSWLIVGGLFAVVALGVLIPMTQLPPAAVALAAVVVDVILYAGMLAARLFVPEGRLRLRLGLMATAMLTIAAVSLVAVLVVAWTAA